MKDNCYAQAAKAAKEREGKPQTLRPSRLTPHDYTLTETKNVKYLTGKIPLFLGDNPPVYPCSPFSPKIASFGGKNTPSVGKNDSSVDKNTPKSLNFTSMSKDFSPNSLDFSPNSLEFSPNSLEFNRKSLDFKPKSPGNRAFLDKSVSFLIQKETYIMSHRSNWLPERLLAMAGGWLSVCAGKKPAGISSSDGINWAWGEDK
ncbi:MAG: hypothetical protein LBT00_12290 [Spirochaetaceae bacterium]|jgi:hypothetical protein|nr:hypothetical protein [Spirochaetaceae bacterium]